MKRASFMAIAAVLAASPAIAHHSGAMYDGAKTMTADGTVKEFQWTNPHSWLQIVAPGDQGAAEWSLELGSLNNMAHNGWKPSTLKPGDKVQVTFHPMRNGSRSGLLMSVVLPDGKRMDVGGGNGAADTGGAPAAVN